MWLQPKLLAPSSTLQSAHNTKVWFSKDWSKQKLDSWTHYFSFHYELIWIMYRVDHGSRKSTLFCIFYRFTGVFLENRRRGRLESGDDKGLWGGVALRHLDTCCRDRRQWISLPFVLVLLCIKVMLVRQMDISTFCFVKSCVWNWKRRGK